MLGSKISGIVVQIDLVSVDHNTEGVNVVDGGANVKWRCRCRVEVQK